MGNFLFFASAILTILGAISVVLVKDIMHACVYLLVSLIGVAGLYLTLGADFVAATQLVVYVGGVVILMVFAVMLTGGASSQDSNKFGMIKTPMMGNLKTYTIGVFALFITLFIIVKILGNIFKGLKTEALGPLTESVQKIGFSLITDNVLAFEISSVLLLGSLIGAAIIARPLKEKVEN